MTPQEFKSWFDGFTEALTSVPTKAQWARIKERVGEIDGKPVTERVFVDRYWPTYYPVYPQYPRGGPYWGAGWSAAGDTILCGTTNTVGQNTVGSNAIGALTFSPHPEGFDSSIAMADLGRADAKALAV